MKVINRKVLIATLLIVGTIISGFATLTFIQGAQASVGTIIRPDPIEIVIPFCQNRTTSICVENFTDLGRFQFKIWWLKEAVNFIGYDWKSLPPGWTGATREGPIFEENTTHKAVTFAITAAPPAPSSYPGAWPFIDLKYHCIKPSVDTDLTFDRAYTKLYNPVGGTIAGAIVDGHVTNPPIQMYWKANYIDYAPSGVPDFDQRQDQWNVIGAGGRPFWSWCAPTAVANSLWWMDSRFESLASPPPARVDTFPLVTNYKTGIDDHDPANVAPFITQLSYLMDTGTGIAPLLAVGVRTKIPHVGTNIFDMQTGIAQYLSWTRVNPPGDVDGDGMVDMTDWKIVNASMGSYVSNGVAHTGPNGQPWDMRADIWPVTLGWPKLGIADNKVDNNDLKLVETYMGSTGYFCEKTVAFPEFSLVEDEVEKCEDVILSIGFYNQIGQRQNSSSDWPGIDVYPANTGHAVTLAGVNSTTMQIAISDPGQNNAETGGLGRVIPPSNHGHNPPDTIHNNATFVSQDIYNVTYNLPPLPGNFSIVNYTDPHNLFQPFPQTYAVVEHAIIISPLHPLPPSPFPEPTKLSDLVQWPGTAHYSDIPFPFNASGSQEIEGYKDILIYLKAKGYTFNPADGTAMNVTGSVIHSILTGEIGTIWTSPFNGTVTSWWSNNTLTDGTRACILSAQMMDGANMTMAFVTNLLPPDKVSEVDPYVIVNAMPYTYVSFYWWAWRPIGKIVSWDYWWYDSQSHPNWFWAIYLWWKTYEKDYARGLPYGSPYPSFPWADWRPWWEWWWHWLYWRHWYWWSTDFPYDS
jgi:hypothetical protein